jgi:hypothetical protein
MHAKETKSRTYMQWSAEPAEASMELKDQQQATRLWTTRRDEKKRRMGLVSSWMSGPLLPREKLVDSLEALIAPKARWRKKCVESFPKIFGPTDGTRGMLNSGGWELNFGAQLVHNTLQIR